MQSELFEREKRYHSALSIAKTMLKRGIITTEELSSIDTLLREKYGSSLAKYTRYRPRHRLERS